MEKSAAKKGSCLCKAVTVTAVLHYKNVGVCHCEMCQKWGSVFTVQAEDVHFVGEENVSIYNSSDWAERGFCRNCGTHLFYRLKEGASKPFINFSVGLFADVPFEFDHQIFIDKKPEFYTFSNPTHDMTEAEVFEKFGDS